MPQRRTLAIAVAAAALAAAATVAAHHLGPEGHEVSPEEAAAMVHRGEAIVVDVRSPGEYAAGHIPRALLVPVGEVDRRAGEISARAEDRAVVLYCRTGRRARIAERILAREGITRIHHLRGQLAGWAAAGLPVER